MSPEALNRWRIIPRLLVAGYAVLVWVVSDWFMALAEPTGAQSAFASAVIGAGSVVFGFYANTGGTDK